MSDKLLHYTSSRARTSLGLLLVVVVLLSSGPGVFAQGIDNVLMDRGNAARTGAQPGPAPAFPVVHWTVRTTEGRSIAQPVVANGLVLVSGGGELVAFDIASGTEQWRRADVGDLSPAVTGEMVIVAGSYGYGERTFVALDLQTGNEQWSFKAKDTPLDVAPIVHKGIAYLLSVETTGSVTKQDTFLFAVEAETGKQLWRHEVKGLVSANPAIRGASIVLGTDNGLEAISVADGERLWRYESDHLINVEHPAISGETVVAGGPSGLFAVDLKTGKLLWESNTHEPLRRNPVGEAPALGQGTVFETGPDHVLRAQSLKDGAVQWTFSGATGAPVFVENAVYVSTDDGLTALDAANGTLLWTVPITVNDVAADFGSPAITGGLIFLAVESHLGTHIFTLGS